MYLDEISLRQNKWDGLANCVEDEKTELWDRTYKDISKKDEVLKKKRSKEHDWNIVSPD